jgi:hypothetical protein
MVREIRDLFGPTKTCRRFRVSVQVSLPSSLTKYVWSLAEEVFALAERRFCWIHPAERIEWDIDADFAQKAFLGFPDPVTDYGELRSKLLFFSEEGTGSFNPRVLERYAGQISLPNQQGAATGGITSSSDTNRTSGAVASRRSP